MVLVRIYDKRYHKGYKIIFFHSDTITEEIIQFVKEHKKAYWIECTNEVYHRREEFLKVYGEDR